jgi:hypothetical protein
MAFNIILGIGGSACAPTALGGNRNSIYTVGEGGSNIVLIRPIHAIAIFNIWVRRSQTPLRVGRLSGGGGWAGVILA